MSYHDPDFDLVMPFVAVKSEGGPYDDDSFAAGFRCATVSMVLAERDRALFAVMAREGELRQLDLIAMRAGYTTKSQRAPDADGVWFDVTFERLAPGFP